MCFSQCDQTLSELGRRDGQLDAAKEERAALQTELSERLNQIDRLDVELAGLADLQRSTAAALDRMNEMDQARYCDPVAVL